MWQTSAAVSIGVGSCPSHRAARCRLKPLMSAHGGCCVAPACGIAHWRATPGARRADQEQSSLGFPHRFLVHDESYLGTLEQNSSLIHSRSAEMCFIELAHHLSRSRPGLFDPFKGLNLAKDRRAFESASDHDVSAVGGECDRAPAVYGVNCRTGG